MKALYLVAALIGVGLGAEPAGGHYLTLADAKAEARREAARVGARVGAETSIATCRRNYRSKAPRHVVDCTAVYRFPAATCERVIRVKYRSPTSSRLRTSHPYEPVCEST